MNDDNWYEEYTDYLVEDLIEMGARDREHALELMEKTRFNHFRETMPDFVYHYNIEYWAKWIMDLVENRG